MPGPSLRLGARHQKRELLWADWAEEELLEDVPHRQVVFTIPKRLRIFFRYHRKLLGELAGCAWRALKLYFGAYFDSADATAGAVGFVQTAGESTPRRPQTPLERHAASTTSSPEPLAHAPPETLELIAESA